MSPEAVCLEAAIDASTIRAARNRYRGARRALEESRRAFEAVPSDITAEQVRWAETALEDAIAVAAELQVPDLPWAVS